MTNPFFFSSVMFRRSAYDQIGGFRPEDDWNYDLTFLHRMAAAFPVDILNVPLIRYRQHPGQISSSDYWERHVRPRSAKQKLRAARALGLPWYLWIVPLLGWLYAMTPVCLRPRRLKQPIKQFLLWAFGFVQQPARQIKSHS
jgi:hypothetical protein